MITEKPTKTDTMIEVQCLECGTVFKIGIRSQLDPHPKFQKCPKCDSFDILRCRPTTD